MRTAEARHSWHSWHLEVFCFPGVADCGLFGALQLVPGFSELCKSLRSWHKPYFTTLLANQTSPCHDQYKETSLLFWIGAEVFTIMTSRKCQHCQSSKHADTQRPLQECGDYNLKTMPMCSLHLGRFRT